MKNYTKDFRSFSINEGWDTVNMGGRSVNVIGMAPRSRSPRFYVVLVDWDPQYAFTSEMEASNFALMAAEEIHGAEAAELAEDMGITDREDYEDLLWDEFCMNGDRISMEQTDPKGMLQIAGGEEELMDLLVRSWTIDDQTREEIYAEATGM